MRPTGNCSPALDERLTAFLAVLPLQLRMLLPETGARLQRAWLSSSAHSSTGR